MNKVNEHIKKNNSGADADIYRNISGAFKDKADCSGINAILRFMREKERVSSELTLSEQLSFIDSRLCIKTRYIELDTDWYKTCALPMLTETVDGRRLAVLPNTDGSCVYIENGRRVKIGSENCNMFLNGAFCFYRHMRNGKITVKELISFLFKSVSAADGAAVLTISVFAVLAGMLLPWANSIIFSRVIPTGDITQAFPAAALIISAVIAAAIFGLLQSLILTNSVLRAGVYIQSSIFSRLMSVKTEFFKNVKSGELSQMIMEFSDITKIVSVRGIKACAGLVLSFAYLIQIRIYAPQLMGYVLTVTAVLAVMMISEGILRSGWLREYSKSLSVMSGFCYEIFSGIEQIKLNGAEARMMKRWSKHYIDTSEKENKPIFLKYVSVFYKIVTIIMTAAVFMLGASLSASDYIAFSAAYGAYIASIYGASEIISAISSFAASYSLVKPLLEAECEEYGADKRKIEKIDGEITVSDLRFRYGENMPYVINGLSVRINKGESIGIIGASGCGKSTLIRLILGFEQPNKGSVCIDGCNLRDIDLRSYRQRIGVVMQGSGTVSGDIYSNITITKPDASIDEVWEAVESAGLKEDITALPLGLHTPISQENCTFSGGQLQRIMIARAIIAKPSILIFDEATSALDNITQAKITESVNKLKCTKIIVAHRISTIVDCDRILVMDNGTVAEEGTFDELMRKDGLFRKISARQIRK